MTMHTHEDKELHIPSCPDCKRMHKVEQPCPRRIARAITTAAPEALKALTVADSLVIKSEDGCYGLSVEDIVEEHLAETL